MLTEVGEINTDKIYYARGIKFEFIKQRSHDLTKWRLDSHRHLEYIEILNKVLTKFLSLPIPDSAKKSLLFYFRGIVDEDIDCRYNSNSIQRL